MLLKINSFTTVHLLLLEKTLRIYSFRVNGLELYHGNHLGDLAKYLLDFCEKRRFLENSGIQALVSKGAEIQEI